MVRYKTGIETQMKKFYDTLNEKDRRRYAAVEASEIGYGGKKYICGLLGCDLKTPDRGNNELNDDISVKSGRVRKKGGGRKSVLKKKSEINEVFLEVVHENTAGSPMDEKIKRTNPSRPRIAELLARKGYKVSVPVVGQLLKKHNFRRRKASETVKGGESRYGNEQFPNISELCPNIRKQVCRF